MNLTEADVQQRIGGKSLKPKNWSRFAKNKTASARLVTLQRHANNAVVETVDGDANQLKVDMPGRRFFLFGMFFKLTETFFFLFELKSLYQYRI